MVVVTTTVVVVDVVNKILNIFAQKCLLKGAL
jgi:hypothetical protein